MNKQTSRFWRIAGVAALALLGALVVAVGAGTLAAAAPAGGTITVDQSAPGCVTTPQGDPYSVVYCTISRAVYDANDGDVINVSAGTYTETINLGGITVTVNGAGAGSTIVDGNGIDDKVMEIYSGSVVTLTGMTIQGGNTSTGYGGGVYNGYCAVTLIDVIVFDNHAGSGGGGVACLGGLTTLRNVSVVSNTTSVYGGGIDIANNAIVVIDGSEVISNTAGSNGGGIYSSAVLTVTDTTIAGNGLLSTYSNGGGIYSTGTTELVRVTVSHNEAFTTGCGGGGIATWGGTLRVVDSVVSENDAWEEGGGIHVDDGAATIEGSAVVSNTSADTGGGLYALATAAVAISNTTVSGNEADTYGGGIDNRTVMTLTNCTVAANVADADSNGSGSGGGYFGYGSGHVGTFVNTILADNVVDSPVHLDNDCQNLNSATNVSLGHNVVENAGNCTFLASGDVSSDPNLGPLADNGGNTWTHALLDGSVARDGGDDATCPATDQRGRTRIPPCDVGAYEYVVQVFLPLVLRSY